MTTNRIKVGIIDLRINNIYSVYQSCKEAGFSTEVVDLNKKKLSQPSYAPNLGENTLEIMKKIGYKTKKINELKEKNIIYF